MLFEIWIFRNSQPDYDENRYLMLGLYRISVHSGFILYNMYFLSQFHQNREIGGKFPFQFDLNIYIILLYCNN